MSRAANTNFDDWETDPDFVRDMDEIDQRWGNKRTVGSINMNELIDEVRRDHKTMRDKNLHSSQRDYSGNLGRSTNLTSSPGFGSKEHISRKVITTSSESSYVRETTNGKAVEDSAKKTIVEKSTDVRKSQTVPPLAPKPGNLTSRLSPESDYRNSRPAQSSTRTERVETKWDADPMPYDRLRTEPPKQFKGSSVSQRIFEEEQKSSASASSSRDNVSGGGPRKATLATGATNPSQAFKSIQDKIDAFKKEFENIESKVAKKSDMSRVIKKTTNVEESNDNVQYVSRSNERLESASGRPYTTSPPMTKQSSDNSRPSSTSPSHRATSNSSSTQPKASIKSLSERFESMGRETSDDFRRRMEERRKEFFDKIKTQVRETRKGLDGFDMIDSDDDDDNEAAPIGKHTSMRSNLFTSPTSASGIKFDASRPSGSQSPSSRPSSRLSDGSQLSSGKPKVYTKRETTQEQIVSRFVKENDKVIHDETKRNVERSSSCHGSSDDEEDPGQPSSIKFIEKELRSSPLERRTQSPIDEIKRKIPLVEPSNKGAGLMARTLYDYQAVEKDELTFDVDDLITNIEKVDQGWYKGTITKGNQKQVGLFPANYVKLLNDSDEY